MSEPHKYHQRPKVVLQANLARGDIKEFLNGFSKQAQGAFGSFIYCPALADFQEVEFQEAEKARLRHKVYSSVLDRKTMAVLLKYFRSQKMSNILARATLAGLDGQVEEFSSGNFNPEMSDIEKADISKDFVMGLLYNRLRTPREDAERAYNNCMHRVRLEKGLINRGGGKADEIEQAAYLATHQFPVKKEVNRIFA